MPRCILACCTRAPSHGCAAFVARCIVARCIVAWHGCGCTHLKVPAGDDVPPRRRHACRPTGRAALAADGMQRVQRCNVATLQRCNGETLQHCNGETLQHCNGATVQRCNGATGQQMQRCNDDCAIVLCPVCAPSPSAESAGLSGFRPIAPPTGCAVYWAQAAQRGDVRSQAMLAALLQVRPCTMWYSGYSGYSGCSGYSGYSMLAALLQVSPFSSFSAHPCRSTRIYAAHSPL